MNPKSRSEMHQVFFIDLNNFNNYTILYAMDIAALICPVIKYFNLPPRKLLFAYVSTRIYTKIDIVII